MFSGKSGGQHGPDISKTYRSELRDLVVEYVFRYGTGVWYLEFARSDLEESTLVDKRIMASVYRNLLPREQFREWTSISGACKRPDPG